MAFKRLVTSKADQFRMMRYSEEDRQHMFEDIDRFDPVISFTRDYTNPECPKEQPTPESMKNFKVNTLFDYSLLENGQDGTKIVKLNGIAPVIEGLLFGLFEIIKLLDKTILEVDVCGAFSA